MVFAHASGVVKSRTSLVVFTSNLKRVHDNPLLHHVANSGAKALPVAVLDASQEGEYQLLSTSLASYGGKLVQRFDSYGQLAAFVKEQTSSIDEVVICPSPLLLQEEKEHLAHVSASARLVTLDDSLLPELQLAGKASSSFSDYKDLYDAAVQQLVATAEKGNDLLAPPLQLAFASQACCDAASTMATTPEETGEARALALVREYLSMGDDAFSLKYMSEFKNLLAKTNEHERSLSRLLSFDADAQGEAKISLFNGEVLSALLAPMLAQGYVSPRLLVQARKSVKLLTPATVMAPLPLFGRCNLVSESVRRDWQNKVAAAASSSHSSSSPWQISFGLWRGYLQRTAFVLGGSNSAKGDSTKPLVVLLHGFGGSIDQFTNLATSLAAYGDFDIAALDSLGFGQSEKPPISYNQYMWRDHALEFVASFGNRKVILVGNSIGGFTAASVAAKLSTMQKEEGGVLSKVVGLVLCNSAGRIVEGGPAVMSTIIAQEKELDFFPPFSGPSPPILRLFGKFVFSLLQPRIKQTTEWLYPKNPSVVETSNLARNILRDSHDPGATDVIAAGGKLPKPVSMNALFDEYQGPILIAQGALDPLNDAKARAASFGAIRGNISVRLLELGHCPHDENGALVAETIVGWWRNLQQTF